MYTPTETGTRLILVEMLGRCVSFPPCPYLHLRTSAPPYLRTSAPPLSAFHIDGRGVGINPYPDPCFVAAALLVRCSWSRPTMSSIKGGSEAAALGAGSSTASIRYTTPLPASRAPITFAELSPAVTTPPDPVRPSPSRAVATRPPRSPLHATPSAARHHVELEHARHHLRPGEQHLGRDAQRALTS